MLMDSRRIQLLNTIRSIEFMLIEFNLYLDSHPCDARAIMQYNCYIQQLMALRREYSRLYGPLTPHEVSTCPWRWIEEPWPWEQDFIKEEEINVGL